jgi:hypothetical protein
MILNVLLSPYVDKSKPSKLIIILLNTFVCWNNCLGKNVRMAYRNKVYMCFDGDNDIHYFYLMKAWKHNQQEFFRDFNFFDAH